MLRNNAFAGDKMSGQGQQQSQVNNDFDAEKYINDYKLLDIRCGVLDEEKQDYLMRI